MQCTAEEIQEKRRQAQEKLAQKCAQNSPVKTLQPQSTSTFPYRSPLKQFPCTNNSPKQFAFKPYDKPKPVVPFYSKNETITGTCHLVSEDRFAVDLSAFSPTTVTVFKTVPSRSYNPKTRVWDFHIKDHDLLHQKLKTLHPAVVVERLPKYVLACCANAQQRDDVDVDLSRLDAELRDTLMPFQIDGISFGIDKQGRCLIADDMGLGKTFQALGIACYYRTDWPLLIVTTASMRNVWEETIHRYLQSVSVLEVQYVVSARDYIGDAKILIVSHDMMTRCLDKLLGRNFGVVIIDESHVLKNFKTKCTKAATLLGVKAKRVVLLSGTPALSRPSELYTQLSILDDKFFGHFVEYSKRYCDGKTTSFGWDASGKSNLQELEIVLAKKFMIRRTKGDILKNLPNKTQEIVKLDVKLNQMSEENRNYFNALAAKYVNEKSGGPKHAALLVFFAETGKIKIPSVCSYVLQTLETTKKFLIFAHHQKMLDAIEKIVQTKDKNYIRIDGNTSCDQRKHLVDKFQLNDNCTCAILSITAANAGITLTAANLVIFAELHWNPTILSQAESRAHRIGQEQVVSVRYLIAPGTADDSIWPLLQSKQKILEEIGLSKNAFGNVAVCDQNLGGGSSGGKTHACTLDITSYFRSPVKVGADDSGASAKVDELFDDDFDQLVCNLEF